MKLETGYHLLKLGWTGKNNVWKLPILIFWKRFFYLLSVAIIIYINIPMWLSSLHAMIQTSTVCNLKWICMCVWKNYNFQFYFGAVVTKSSMNCSTTVTKASLLWKRRSKITSIGRFCQKLRLNNWSDFDHCTVCHFSWQQTYPSPYTLKTVWTLK